MSEQRGAVVQTGVGWVRGGGGACRQEGELADAGVGAEGVGFCALGVGEGGLVGCFCEGEGERRRGEERRGEGRGEGGYMTGDGK